MSANLQAIASFLNNKNITNRDAIVVALIVLIVSVVNKFLFASIIKIIKFCFFIMQKLISNIKEIRAFERRLRDGEATMGDITKITDKSNRGKRLTELEEKSLHAYIQEIEQTQKEQNARIIDGLSSSLFTMDDFYKEDKW